MKKGMKGFSLYLIGTIFIMLGILVVFFPILLMGLFSAGLIVLGIAAISVAHRLKKYHSDTPWTVHWEEVDSFMEKWPHRVFVRRWC